ncbi:hypothetical protein ES708_05168 [subsurface metagenome]
MKSLHTRLGYRKDKVVDFTRKYGQFAAMSEFGAHDLICFRRWLKEVTGNENFGLRPEIGGYRYGSVAEQFVAAFICKVTQLQAENETLRSRVRVLEREVSINRHADEELLVAALEVCQV